MPGYSASIVKRLTNQLSENRELLSIAAANLVGPVCAVLVSPILARELGPGGRGEYAALTVPIIVAGLVGTFGVQDGLAYFISQRNVSPRTALRVALRVVGPLVVLSAAITIGVGLFAFPPDLSALEFWVVVALAPLQVVNNLVVGVAMGARDVRAINTLKIVPTLARTVVIVALCVLLELTPFWAAFVLLLSSAVGTIRPLIRLYSGGVRSQDDGVTPRRLLRFSLTAFPGVLALVSSAKLDQMLGLPLIGRQELGLYAIAVTFAELPLVVSTATRMVLMGTSASSGTLYKHLRVLRFSVVFCALACILLALCAPLVIPIAFGRDYLGAVVPSVILLLGTIAYSIGTGMSSLLLVLARARAQSICLIAGAAVGVCALVLLREEGAVGAAIASVIGYVVSLIFSWILLRRASGLTLSQMIRPGIPHLIQER